MTDTGQIPGEGQPENSGGQPDGQQPGFPVNGSYPYTGPGGPLGDAQASGFEPVDPELLLPGSHGAWNDPHAAAAAEAHPQVAVQQDVYGQDVYGQDPYAPGPYAQHDPYAHQNGYAPMDPYAGYGQVHAQVDVQHQAQAQAYAEAQAQAAEEQQSMPREQFAQPQEEFAQPQEQPVHVPGPHEEPEHVPGPHETDGRDSGAIDCGAVRAANPQSQETPAQGTRRAQTPPRRPLHLGPPVPEQSGAVRPLSDRGIGGRSRKNSRKDASAQGAGPAPAAQPQAQPQPQPQSQSQSQVQPQPETGQPQPQPQPQSQVQPQPETGQAQPTPQQDAAAPQAQPQPQAEPTPRQGEFTAQYGTPVAQEAGATSGGLEYLDFPQADAEALPGPQLGALPPENETWAEQPVQQHADMEAEAPAGPQEAAAYPGQQPAAARQENAPVPGAVPDQVAPHAASEAPDASTVSAIPQTPSVPGERSALPEESPVGEASSVMPEAPEAPSEAPEAQSTVPEGPSAASEAPSTVAEAPAAEVAAVPPAVAEASPAEAPVEAADVPPAVPEESLAVSDGTEEQPQESAPTATDEGSAAAAPEAKVPASRSGGGRKRKHRRAKGESSNETTGSGNTWVSSPGSTAVEAIEPRQQGTATAVEGEGAVTPAPEGAPDMQGAEPGAEGAKIPAQNTGELPAVEAEPAHEAVEDASGNGEGPEAVAAIPAQQARHAAQPPAGQKQEKQQEHEVQQQHEVEPDSQGQAPAMAAADPEAAEEDAAIVSQPTQPEVEAPIPTQGPTQEPTRGQHSGPDAEPEPQQAADAGQDAAAEPSAVQPAATQDTQTAATQDTQPAEPAPAPAPDPAPEADAAAVTEDGSGNSATVPQPAAGPSEKGPEPVAAASAGGETSGGAVDAQQPSPVTDVQGSAPGSEQAEAGPETGTDAAKETATQSGTQSQPQPGEESAPEPAAESQEPGQEGDAQGDAPEQADAPEEADAVPAGSPAPGYADEEREAVHRLMRERRDIRNGFRPDPIPHEVLLRVLEAAHTAPSVGHSQPWDFVVIRSEETRRAMHELAERQRHAYAESLPKARAKQFKELKIEAILDTPVNIVVTADPTRGGRHTLGRHTQPQMAPYSSALAVENLWLAARAEGLGVGWVSFFDEREMVRALELPEHLEVVAYLCVGYVDEFPPEPELAQAGWSKRRPLSWVVHEESYGRRVLPGAEPQDLLSDTVAAIRPLDAKALGEAWERQKRMTKPAGALGMLEIISAQLCGLSRKCPPPLPEPAAVAIFAGDHGVHAQGVTPWPQEVTGQMVANFLGGGAVCNAFANQVGAEVCVVDVGVASELPSTPGLLPRKVRAGTDDMTQGPAMTREEALRAVEVGIETARDLVAAGNKALLTGEMGIANTTASAVLISACTGTDASEVTGRGTGINDETHARKVEVVRRALEVHQPDPEDPLGMLAAVGGLEHAALVGLILGGASLRTPVILDGVSAGAAALVARCVAPEALAACIAGHRSSEPGHVAALTKLGLRPLVDLDLRLGEGTGALLSLPMVQSAARAMHEVATFDSAGVTGKG